MKTTVRCVIVASVLLAGGCKRDDIVLAGSRFASLGNAQLVTQFQNDSASGQQVPLFHILFVPAVRPSPGNGFGMSGGGSGTAQNLKFDYVYDEFDAHSRKISIRSRPVYIRNLKTLDAQGRSFALARGSVFVAHVALDGQLNVMQLPWSARDHDSEPADLLEAIKRYAPSDERLRSVP